jgi:hypothetical protein
MTLDDACDAALLSISDFLALADLLSLAQTTRNMHRYLVEIPELAALYKAAQAATRAGALPSQIAMREQALERNGLATEAARRVKLIAQRSGLLSLTGAGIAEFATLYTPEESTHDAHLAAAGLAGAGVLLGVVTFLAWCKLVDLDEGGRALRLRFQDEGAYDALLSEIAQFADHRLSARRRREDNAAGTQSMHVVVDIDDCGPAPI